MKRIALVLTIAAACGGRYQAPPAVPVVNLPAGSQLKPYDPARPGLPRPMGMALVNGVAYVALGNYDASYAVRGPGMLARIVPSTGATTLIDLGGSDEKQCKNAGFVRLLDGKLYVSCAGDYNDGSGTAIVEVDPGTNAVTRRLIAPTSPSGIAATSSRLWFGDAYSGAVYGVDLSTFTISGTKVSITCPATGNYSSTSDLAVINDDLYAICSNSTDAVLNRLDATSGASKGTASVGPIAVELAATGDGRIAVVSGADNKLRLVTIPAMTVQVGYSYSGQTSTLQDVRALDQFVFTVASGSNTVQKIDLSANGGPKLVDEQSVGANSSPWNILPLDDFQALVSNQMSNTVVAVRWAH